MDVLRRFSFRKPREPEVETTASDSTGTETKVPRSPSFGEQTKKRVSSFSRKNKEDGEKNKEKTKQLEKDNQNESETEKNNKKKEVEKEEHTGPKRSLSLRRWSEKVSGEEQGSAHQRSNSFHQFQEKERRSSAPTFSTQQKKNESGLIRSFSLKKQTSPLSQKALDIPNKSDQVESTSSDKVGGTISGSLDSSSPKTPTEQDQSKLSPSSRRLSFRGFKRSFKSSEKRTNDEISGSPKSQDKFPKKRFNHERNFGKLDRNRSENPNVDTALGIYNAVLKTKQKNVQIAENPTYFVERENTKPLTRSRSLSHTNQASFQPPRQHELLVSRPTGKLRQTLLKPFTSLNASKLKSKFPAQENLAESAEEENTAAKTSEPNEDAIPTITIVGENTQEKGESRNSYISVSSGHSQTSATKSEVSFSTKDSPQSTFSLAASQGKVFDLKNVLTFVEPEGLPSSIKNSDEGKEPNFKAVNKALQQKIKEGRKERNFRSAPAIQSSSSTLRIGNLFMLVPLISENWNVYYCELTISRFSVFEKEGDKQPIFSILLTEINELLKEHNKSPEGFICTIFSHSIAVVKFMASDNDIRDWIIDLEAARVEALKIVCSSATLKEGHSPCSFDQIYNISGDRGIGGFSFVKEAIDRETGKHVIVKFLNKASVKLSDEGIPLEIDILSKMKHVNIVEIKEVFESEDYFIFIMEKFGKGIDLFDFLQEQEKLSEEEARNIFKQVLSAVVHLASQNVVHGDIKDENIIIDLETQQVKLIDFGSNKRFDSSNEEFTIYHGTKHMACPEIISNQPFKPLRQEIWSLGVLLFILLTGEIPFETEEDILEGALPEDLRYKLSDECRDLLCTMLETNPKFQASLQDIMNHDWLKYDIV